MDKIKREKKKVQYYSNELIEKNEENNEKTIKTKLKQECDLYVENVKCIKKNNIVPKILVQIIKSNTWNKFNNIIGFNGKIWKYL